MEKDKVKKTNTQKTTGTSVKSQDAARSVKAKTASGGTKKNNAQKTSAKAKKPAATVNREEKKQALIKSREEKKKAMLAKREQAKAKKAEKKKLLMKKREEAKAKKIELKKAMAEKRAEAKAAKTAKKKALMQKRAKMNKKNAQKKLQKQEQKQERIAMLNEKRAEKERMHAKKRMEAAKLKEERKELKKQAAQAKATAAARKAKLMKQEREKNKRIKEERKKLIKSESKQQRTARIAAEKAEKQKLRREKKLLRQRLKEEKRHAAKLKAESKKSGGKRSPAIGGWLAAVIALGVSTLVLASMLAITYKGNVNTQGELSGTYQKSFYDLVSYVDNMDNNLSKLQVANTSSQQQRLLTNVLVQAELAENNVQQLPITDESKFETVGFINSVGDYARALLNKLGAGEKLSEEESENLSKIYKSVAGLKAELSELAGQAADGYDFKSLKKGGDKDLILGKFGEMENNSVEYPKLIYDGPFSAALENRTAKGLANYEEITREQAIEKFNEYFKDYKVTSVESEGEVNSRSINGYNVNAKLEDGSNLYAQISKKGGKLIMFNMYGDCKTQNFDADTCVEIASEFLEATGHKNMRAVWINDSSNIANINFAYTENDVIVYPDMIKVKVCQEKGKVIGMEANSYYLNHAEGRNVKTTLSQAQARANVSSKIDIQTARLTIIPTSGGNEVAAYEFMGTYDGATYYIYINAKTGNEAEVFRVIETTEGNLLM